ncbi:MAG: fumarate hydratase [Candidatus Omnitrophota bacterium]
MKSRKIMSQDIEETVKDLCLRANTVIRPDVRMALETAYEKEEDLSISKKMIGILLENARIAEEKALPLCQDTGMVTVFVKLGSEIVVSGGTLPDAINKGVEKAYSESPFRKSVVESPITRKNTGTNTPAIIHIEIVKGAELAISVMPKGFGSENKSRSAMLNPTGTLENVSDFCVETVKIAGSDACPPYILGVGIGGTMEECALLAKKALLRPIDRKSQNSSIAEAEHEIEKRVNDLKIGVMGLGGKVTVIGVNIEEAPTHIAGFPIAVNLSCHALRSASAML